MNYKRMQDEIWAIAKKLKAMREERDKIVTPRNLPILRKDTPDYWDEEPEFEHKTYEQQFRGWDYQSRYNDHLI